MAEQNVRGLTYHRTPNSQSIPPHMSMRKSGRMTQENTIVPQATHVCMSVQRETTIPGNITDTHMFQKEGGTAIVAALVD